MEYLKMNLAEEMKKQEPQDIKDYMNVIEEKKYKLQYMRERFASQSATLEHDIQQLEKTSFDIIVRKVIDSGLVYMKCQHKDIEKSTTWKTVNMNPGFDDDAFEELRRREFTLGGGTISSHSTWGNRESGIFYGICKKCHAGINRHDCSVEGETYYFTCDEARVVNNVARQYGVKGSIHTATRVQD